MFCFRFVGDCFEISSTVIPHLFEIMCTNFIDVLSQPSNFSKEQIKLTLMQLEVFDHFTSPQTKQKIIEMVSKFDQDNNYTLRKLCDQTLKILNKNANNQSKN